MDRHRFNSSFLSTAGLHQNQWNLCSVFSTSTVACFLREEIVWLVLIRRNTNILIWVYELVDDERTYLSDRSQGDDIVSIGTTNLSILQSLTWSAMFQLKLEVRDNQLQFQGNCLWSVPIPLAVDIIECFGDWSFSFAPKISLFLKSNDCI